MPVRVCTIRIIGARSLLHGGEAVGLRRKAAGYARLTAICAELGGQVASRAPRTIVLHATPGHCVLIVDSRDADKVERLVTAPPGIQISIVDGGHDSTLDTDGWSEFAESWLAAQRDTEPKPVARTGFEAPSRSPLYDDGGYDDDGYDEPIAADLALMRVDVSGLRDSLLSACASGTDLIRLSMRINEWFTQTVPRVVPADIVILHSVSDDIVLVGKRQSLLELRPVLTESYAEIGIGSLQFGVGGPDGCRSLADRSRVAAAEMKVL